MFRWDLRPRPAEFMFSLMRIEKSSRTVFTPLADGTGVLLNLDTLLYFSLNRTGTQLWQQIDSNPLITMDDLLRETCKQFEVTEVAAHQSISAFIRQLEQLKMIRLV